MEVVYSQHLKHGRFETRTEKPVMPFHDAHQVHGIDIVSLETLPCEADGLMVSWEEFKAPLAIKTADCLPVLIEGNKGVVFLHAGWRGLAQGILERAELSLIDPQSVLIGPSIQQCCFEVSPDFSSNFPQNSSLISKEGKYFFNLQKEAKRRLMQKFPQLEIEISPLCTCCDHSLHSFRRNKTTSRNWNLFIKG